MPAHQNTQEKSHDELVFSPMYELKSIPPLAAEIEIGDSFCGGLNDIGFYMDRWILFYHHPGIGTAYYEEAEMRRSAQIAFERYSNPSQRLNFTSSVQNILAEIDQYIRSLGSQDLAKQETDVLLSLLKQGWDLEARVFALYNATQPQNSSLIEAAIRSELASKRPQESVDDLLGILSTPDRLSRIAHEELDALELIIYLRALKIGASQSETVDLQEVTADDPEINRAISSHFHNYKTLMLGDDSWDPQISNLYNSLEAKLKLDDKEIIERRDELANYEKRVIVQKQSLIKDLELNSETINLCEAAALIGETRLSLRTDGWAPLIFAIRPVLREVARRIQVNARDLIFQTREEFWSLFTHQPLLTLSDLKVRAQSNTYLMAVADGQIKFYYGDEARDEFATRVTSAKVDRTTATVIRGAPAMKGKVAGQVLVYNWGDDMQAALRKISDNTILVAGQSRPQLMPLIRQSIGMVTDEGGIVSHAAIVARELKLPCVVGTKVATKYLMTGDLVELDATNGTITILKKRSD